MQVFNAENAAFVREARDLVFQHSLNMSRGNLLVFQDEGKVEFVAHQMRDGKIASQDLVVATVVREDGRLKFKHADIHYEFI